MPRTTCCGRRRRLFAAAQHDTSTSMGEMKNWRRQQFIWFKWNRKHAHRIECVRVASANPLDLAFTRIPDTLQATDIKRKEPYSCDRGNGTMCTTQYTPNSVITHFIFAISPVCCVIAHLQLRVFALVVVVSCHVQSFLFSSVRGSCGSSFAFVRRWSERRVSCCF